MNPELNGMLPVFFPALKIITANPVFSNPAEEIRNSIDEQFPGQALTNLIQCTHNPAVFVLEHLSSYFSPAPFIFFLKSMDSVSNDSIQFHKIISLVSIQFWGTLSSLV